MSKEEKSPFSHFFKEDAPAVKEIFSSNAEQQDPTDHKVTAKDVYPRWPRKIEVSESENRAYWLKLRSFFRNAENKENLSGNAWPVIISPVYTKSLIGLNFPICLVEDNYSNKGLTCLSLHDLLQSSLDQVENSGAKTSILKRNLERIVHITNKQLSDSLPNPFQQSIEKVFQTLTQQLDIKGSEKVDFENAIDKLQDILPKNGSLISYSALTSFQVLEAAMHVVHQKRRPGFEAEIFGIRHMLADLLKIEEQKGPESKDPDKLKDSLSFIGSAVKFDELSSIFPESASEAMSNERKERIQAVINELDNYKQLLAQENFLFIDKKISEDKAYRWDKLFEGGQTFVFEKGNGCDTFSKVFVEQIKNWTKLLVARRIGNLELQNQYQSEVHDEFFKYFNWESFAVDELQLCPQFVMLADDDQLFESEYSKLSTILSSNIPLKIVAVKHDDYIKKEDENGQIKKVNLHSHAELGALMLSHKNMYVVQSTSITPTSLFESFETGLSAFAPAFFYILNVDEKKHNNPYVWASATIEARDFPGFTYAGLLGTPWGSRFNIDNNPQTELIWPSHKLTIEDEEGQQVEHEFQFTFADLAMLNPAYKRFFMPVETSYWSEDLILLTEYLENKPEHNIGKVPFIWISDESNELKKLAVSWPVVVATQERVDFWRFLQENSGINNFHVSKAVENERIKWQEKHVNEVEKLKENHAKEVLQIKREEADQVMENLSSVLLGLDLSNVNTVNIGKPDPTQSIPAESKKPESIVKKEAVVEELDDLIELTQDPYIDTVLCTSCNECLNINKQMFHYNENKMAYIADAKAGTYSDLVEAAEKCPVAIIHPGMPLDPNEPDLDNLIERASKFN